jgi:pyruvate-formate lyase-activating enzyme
MKKKEINQIILKDQNVERTKDAGDFPKIVLVDTVNYCNLRCSMCGRRKMTRKGGMMEMALYQKIIDEIAERDKTVRVWLVFFGDPFMLQDRFYPLISYAKSRGLKDVVVNTNGNLMDEKHAYKLIESGLDAIYIGIDAVNPETYAKLRVGGNLEKVKTNVKSLIKAKKDFGADKPAVFVQFVEMEENKHEKAEFIRYWTQEGAIVKVRPKVSWAGTVEAENLMRDKKRYPCYWAMRTMNILYNGRVCLCAIDYDGKFITGDVSKDSLQSVWLRGLKGVRDLQLSGQYRLLPPICRDCLDWQAAKAEFTTC